MKLKVAWIGKTRLPGIQELTDEYVKRLGKYCEFEGLSLKHESALLNFSRNAARSQARHELVLLDSKGKQLSSEELARWLGNYRNWNTLPPMFAVGPADGFSEEVRQEAGWRLSLGRMTLAHELARIVLLEQLYRAFTILKGHPYHTGH